MTEQQSIPIAQIITVDSKNNHINNDNNTKLSLLQFDVDQSTGKVNSTKLGSKSIIVRQDLINDLKEIKSILNSYNIPLTCEFIDVKLDNNYISKIAKLGLEINLNNNSALTTKNDLYNDDYYIGPDYNKPYGNGYKLKIYAKAHKSNHNRETKYTLINYPVDIYDIRQTANKKPPLVKKIFKPLLDLTRIFEDYGFRAVPPNKEFFYYSDNKNSNWFKFYKPNKIKIGDTYIQCLSKIYDNNNEPIWQDKDTKWDGEKFI